MNLQQLEYFKTAAEFENYTIASEILSITQPALSKAISNLEEELNVPLFEKEGRNVKLTKFGHSFLKHVNIALKELTNGIDELKHLTSENDNIIRIASTHSVSNYFISFMINDFLKLNPDTRFEFYTTSLSELLKDLNNKKIDLGFFQEFNGIEKLSSLESIPIKSEKYVIIVSKKNKLAQEKMVSLADLKDETFIISSECNKNKIISACKSIGFNPNISIITRESNMLKSLVENGTGIALVPLSPSINTNEVSILDVTEKIGERKIYLGSLKKVDLSSVVLSFKKNILKSSLELL